MNLYELPASNCAEFWGDIGNPTGVHAIVIAQKPDCSSFLVLSEPNDLLVAMSVIPEGFDFTYCQEWGLEVTEELISRIHTSRQMACCKEIEDFANAKYAAGIVYLGNTYQIDDVSRTEIGLRSIYATNSNIDPISFPWIDPFDRGWRDVANVYHAMTAVEFMAFGKAVSYYCACIKCCCWDHCASVTAENHATYDYSTGWPVQP